MSGATFYAIALLALAVIVLMIDSDQRALKRRVKQMDRQLQAMEGRNWLKRSREARGKEDS